ncbi:hypothetical protein [Weissella paramesenteroides]|uniref:hypothetical protein n=1 Tax=Weissella paramesenteroides TaxID=1249 RepID=UPI002E7B896F|nr:hypothetical protein [Weissella paramesenteroides]WPQ68413.1 hypothetical protein QRX23_02105 [Weissella paramesenteroides]
MATTFKDAQNLLLEQDLDDELAPLVIYEMSVLKDTYAPTIEMTEMQMKQMMSFKEVNAGFSTFMYKQGLGHVPAFSEFITTKREDELMTAWLHPETIEMVE